ncbi:rRNA maturation RNase YbeY [Candidatus Uhrbacteria bacterium]|nr:rRNA maturation RNase YbeY [Candidatus Uhrbacteria bacterium]
MRRRSITIALFLELDGAKCAAPQQIFEASWYQKLCSQIAFCAIDTNPFPLSVVLVDERRIRELNGQYRGLHRSTDVLSFAYGHDRVIESGELYVCLSFALRQRARFHTTKKQEIARLFFHGLLHILGHDHDSRTSRKAMRALEDCLMTHARTHHLW